MAGDLFLLIVSFAVIIVGAELFTNGVEWLGVRLRLSEGAVGSVLAAVGTALPETLIPFVALVLFKGAADHEVGLGAILGAPFMLATLAFFVTALAAIIFRKRRSNGILLAVNRDVASRDLGFFFPLYGAAIAVSFSPIGHWARYAVAVAIFCIYCYYVWLNLKETAESGKEEPLIINLMWAALPLLPPGPPDRERAQKRRDHLNANEPRLRAVTGQVLLALTLIVGGAYIFVGACRAAAYAAGFSPLIFALIIAPVATELPEKFNSVIWVKGGKDTLSLGNITGAMVFQATFPVSLGIFLTDWHFGGSAAGNAALLSAGIALASAALLFVTIRLNRKPTFFPWPMMLGVVWWLVFVGYVVKTIAMPAA